MNNCVWYYRFVDQVAKLQTMRTYLSTVQYVKLSRDLSPSCRADRLPKVFQTAINNSLKSANKVLHYLAAGSF